MERITYPLTSGQKVIGYAGQLYPNGAVNNIGGLLLLEDELDFELLRKAIRLCVERNDALRLRIIKSDDQLDLVSQYFVLDTVRQYVTDELPSDIPLVDFTGKTQHEMEEEILGWNRKPINVFEQPLCEFVMVKAPDGRQGVYSKVDHLATDAWMSGMMGVEIIELYYALKRGGELPPKAYSFIDYIAEERAYIDSERFHSDEKFWMSLYDKPLPLTFFNESNDYPQSITGHTDRLNVLLDADFTANINGFCKQFSVSPANFFETALGIYLYQKRNSQDVVFGSPTLTRSTLREKRTCGSLVNNLNVRLFLDENKPFHEVCEDCNLQQLAMVRHLRYPQLYLMMHVYMKHNIQSMWDAMITYHVGRMQTKENVRFETKWLTSGSFASPLYIGVTDLDDAGRYLLYYEYQTEPFTLQQIEGLNTSLLSIVRRGIEHPDTLLRSL